MGFVITGAQHAREVSEALVSWLIPDKSFTSNSSFHSIDPFYRHSLMQKCSLILIFMTQWIATATSLYLTHALVTHPSANASEPDNGSLSWLLDKFDFYIVPAPNPDGYDYTWESDRFWCVCFLLCCLRKP
jgi:hypothetical protein